MPDPIVGAAEALARHARRFTLAAVLLMALIGWGWLLLVAGIAGGTHGFGMPGMQAWGAVDIALVALMWIAMVFAMMLPTAAPTFRVYARLGSRMAAGVMAGYTAVWLGIAILATLAQTGLTYLGVLTPHMAAAGQALSASILIAAGIYQFTPLKRVCLIRCRNPYATEIDEPTPWLSFRIGLEEGLACLGCCWALMTVMFAAGLMNLVAMGLLGALMGLEKLATGLKFTYLLGLLLAVLGIVMAGDLYFM